MRAARLDNLALGADRVAGKDRTFDMELHVQKSEAGVLYRRLHQQALGKGTDERHRREASPDIGFVGKLAMSASVTVRPYVGNPASDRQILEMASPS